MGNEVPLTAAAAELEVHLAYDPEADVWYVADSDIPGLVLEADTPLELLRRVIEAAPELVELNAGFLESGPANDVPRPERLLRRPIAVRPVFDAPFEIALP